ncbi:MAG: hypothetical protein ACRCZF_22855, partial [Gemmataceae bacterium]
MLQNSINPGAINRYSSTREMLGNRLNYEDLNKRLAETQTAFGRKPTSGGVIVGGVKSEILSGAAAVSLGEIFEYTIPEPLSLPRLKSALLPILSSTIDTSRVSIYNESTLVKHPLLGLKLVNKTPHHLSQGPITVYEGEAFAGDARLPDLKPNEGRLISYAIDLGTEVVPSHPGVQTTISNVSLSPNVIQYTNTLRFTHKYLIRNRNSADRTVIIELPAISGRKLVSPEKPSERSRDMYRFEVAVKAGGDATFEVIEDSPTNTTVVSAQADDDTLRGFLREGIAGAAVREGLSSILSRRAELLQVRKDIQSEADGLKAVNEDQSRIRANIERVPEKSEAYKRYLKKFDEQETQIENYQAKLKTLQSKLAGLDEEYKKYLSPLNVKTN